MPDGKGFLWRPVLRGVFPAAALYDGTLDLCKIADANEAIDVWDENARRMNERP